MDDPTLILPFVPPLQGRLMMMRMKAGLPENTIEPFGGIA